MIGLPTLTYGLQADDHMLLANVSAGQSWRPFATESWDLFHFYGDATATEVIDRGLAPWWANPEAHARLFRPLSSLTHSVELSMWPGQPWLMHLHSLLWYAALCALVALLYRRLINGWAAGLASLMFVIDYTHGPPMAWIANRNALIAGTLGIACLCLHYHHRAHGNRRAGWAAPVCLALGFGGGEVALAACAYLLAYALCLETGPRLRRLVTLWPYAPVGVVWVVLYIAGDFGARGSGAYLDPMGSPVAFLTALPGRMMLAMAGELGGPMPDFWMMLSPAERVGLVAIATSSCALAVAAVVPLLRRDPVARFFALGATLATVPVCGAFPSSRLMLVPGFGLVGLVALLVQAWRERAPWLPQRRARRWLTAAFAVVAGGSHLVLSPPLLYISQRQIHIVERQVSRLGAGLPGDELQGAQLVIVNPPGLLLTMYLLPQRATRGAAQPKSLFWIGQGTHELTLERTGPRVLIARDPRGFYGDGFSTHARPKTLPMPPDTTVRLTGVTVRVLEAPHGVPTAIELVFEHRLDAPGLIWRAWNGATLVPFEPPPVDTSIVLPAHRHPLLDPDQFP